ncbi:MAG: cell envelope biogenesis protein OmpA [Winogradskyella sp.]|uniref:outer membrane beta-barrel protein n=1 Tax=Winogradskyella sp. TaxID=1883156 RepID=UPI00179FE05E|nr:outer membrane beta-barrel protein [Winogradskyella sp.]MBT8244489.1 cell envelope biogenesis protein OmpA [Winogradskyella sp.]NNK22838.1 cell envelope biogenesis protein OmpA [Winogradskyella sp.]
MRFKFAKYSLAILLLFSSVDIIAQRRDIPTWSAQIGLGTNLPSKSGFVDAYPAQSLNFPTVNLGVQRMFTRSLGARLDYGFNRFKSEDDLQEFKVNYSRINTQLVYNPSEFLSFLPQELQLIGHTGPGYSIATPLGNLDVNKQSYLNFNLGIELHYFINRKVNLYTDISYIYGFSSLDDYDPELLGLGAFNGSMLNVTVGVSIALSGCYYCE